jgi:hypothetical protein
MKIETMRLAALDVARVSLAWRIARRNSEMSWSSCRTMADKALASWKAHDITGNMSVFRDVIDKHVLAALDACCAPPAIMKPVLGAELNANTPLESAHQ